jgi:hypothetical protein
MSLQVKQSSGIWSFAPLSLRKPKCFLQSGGFDVASGFSWELSVAGSSIIGLFAFTGDASIAISVKQ